MRSYSKYLILAIALVLIFTISTASANDLENSTLNSDNSSYVISEDVDNVIGDSSEEITVNDWDDLQFYCAKSDKNYVLKLKENTNYYPTDLSDESYQVQVKNNVTIIGSSGAYFGDASPDARNIHYIAFDVPENSGNGIALKNVTFKWIATSFMPDAVFLRMGGNATNMIENCQFYNCTLVGGHSSLVYLMRGDLTLTNCSFKNIDSDFGCVSIYDPKDNPYDVCTNARGEVDNCYFEGNYAKTEPGCINNCGILVVRNSTFYKNAASRWAGAIHTHGGANTTIYDSNFTDNLAGWNGGALYTYSYLQIYNTIFIGNNCTTNNGGGAIGASKYLHSPYIHIEDSLFDDNENLCWGLDELSTSGTGRGGAISIMDDGELTVLNTTFIKNSASIGTAICANMQGGYGSPNVTIIGNRFINHTRAGDVLVVRLTYDSICEIRDNYYSANSIEFSRLKLIADERIGDEVTIHVDATLKNPDSYDSDILDKSGYDVYMDGQYLKTVYSKDFTVNLRNIEKAQVYVVPCISISKSSTVSVGMPVEYIYVSQKSGSDNNNGSKEAPVKTIAKAIELANQTGNIVMLDGTFSEKNLDINYNLTIKGENNVVFSSKGNIFNITNVDVSITNIAFKNCKQDSTSKEHIIKQSGGTLKLEDCTFESNSYNTLIESAATLEANNLKFTRNTGILIQSDDYAITSSVFENNTATTKSKSSTLIKSNNALKATISDSRFSNNHVIDGCIYFYTKSTQNILKITDSTFINNVANSGCSGIQMPYSGGLLDVKSSLFANNTDSGNGAVILTSTEVHVADSIFLNNAISNSNNAVINSKNSANLKKIYCDGNWFGNTQDNYNVTPQISSSSNYNYWLYLNASANSASMFIGQSTPVTFDLNNIYYKNGETSYWDSSNLPAIELSISTTGGKSSQSKVALVYGMADTIYTLTDVEGSLIASYYGFNDVINFTKAKLDAKMNVSCSNISVDDDEVISVDLVPDATGNITVTVANITQTQQVVNSKTIFTLSDLPAGNLTAIVTYSGDAYYDLIKKSIQFSVSKYDSTTSLSVGQVDVGCDVILAVNVSPSTTGNVTLIINNRQETLTLVNSKANYTIKSITRGDYNIEAIYNGNYKYLTSMDSYKFSVDKLNTTISLSADDIVYGQNAIIEVVLSEDATGNVTVSVNGENTTCELFSGKVVFNISGLNAGHKDVFAYYGGDNVFNAIDGAASFDVAKASTALTINANGIMVGHDENIEVTVGAGVSGNITIVCDGQSIVKTIPRTGKVSWKLSGLAVGEYIISASLRSDNYLDAENTTEFKVSDYETPQWPNEGYDIQNTGKSPYDADSNGAILWKYSVDGKVIANMAIDCNGNVYLVTSSGVYAIGDANQLWNYNQTNGGNLSGVAIGRDVVISPEIGNTLHFINQTTGERFGKSNIYQGSSLFSPVIDSNANIYISSERQVESSDYKLVIIPYAIWENGGNPTLISLGDSEPTSAPVIVNENIAVVACADSLKIIDLDKKQILSSIKGNSNGIRPVVGQGNMIYAVLDDYLVELTPEGNQIWKSKITGGAGKYLSLNDELGLYCLNSQANLYRYDLIDGSETLISNLTFTSAILIGNDGNVYIGSKDMFYAFDSEGSMLWKTYLGSEVIGNPVVDKDGVIYVTTDDNLYALSSSELKNANLTVSVEDIAYGEDAVVNITLNSDAIGEIEVKISSNSYNNVSKMDWNGRTISLSLSGLSVGSYKVEVKYNGDLRYKKASSQSQFEVGKIEASISSTAKDIEFGENAEVTVNLPNDATGNVILSINGIDYNKSIESSVVKFEIPNLNVGSYNYLVNYSGDGKYLDASASGVINVGMIDTAMNVTAQNCSYGDDALINVELPDGATGNISVVINGKSYYSDNLKNVSVSGLDAGAYLADVFYSGDSRFKSTNSAVEFTVNKVDVSINVTIYPITFGEDAIISIVLPDNIKGNITVGVANKTFTKVILQSDVNFTISDLKIGTYDVVISYSGDLNHLGSITNHELAVNKKVANINASCEDIEVGEVATVHIEMDSDATGNITVTIDNKDYEVILKSGKANVSISDLEKGEYVYVISYSGDDYYQSANFTGSLAVGLGHCVVSASCSDIKVGETAIITIEVDPIVWGNVTVIIDGRNYSAALENGVCSISVSGLASGSYDALIKYLGNDQYKSAQCNVSFNVLKIDPNLTVSVDSITYGENAVVNVDLPSDAAGNVTISVGGRTYMNEYVISGLNAGNFTAEVSYSGDEKYYSASAAAKFSVELAKVNIDIANNDIYYSGEFVAILTDLKGNAISDEHLLVDINNQNYDLTTDSEGKIYITLRLNAGNYTATVNFKGSNDYSTSSINSQINVLSTIQANDGKRGYNSGADFKAKFLAGDGSLLANSKVTFIVDGVEYFAETDGDGVAVLNAKLGVGNHEITALNNLTGENSTYSLSIAKRIVENKALTMDYLDGSYFKVRIIGDDGNYVGSGVKVAFKVGSKTYYATTNAKGYASYKFTLTPKTYTVKTTYKGYTVSNKLVIKQILKAKNVSKKKAKSYKFSATLKTSKGKAIKNKKITFKIKGKKYTSKTNKKGVATITIKLKLKPGKYTITSTYSKTTIKNKLTIKK